MLFVVFSSEELHQAMCIEREAATHRAVVRIQSWVRRYLAMKSWPKLRLSLQQSQQQREAGQSQQRRGLDRGSYDVSVWDCV